MAGGSAADYPGRVPEVMAVGYVLTGASLPERIRAQGPKPQYQHERAFARQSKPGTTRRRYSPGARGRKGAAASDVKSRKYSFRTLLAENCPKSAARISILSRSVMTCHTITSYNGSRIKEAVRAKL